MGTLLRCLFSLTLLVFQVSPVNANEPREFVIGDLTLQFETSSDWQIEEDQSEINLTRIIDARSKPKSVEYIQIRRVPFTGFSGWTAEQIAADYRLGEVNNMQEQGIKTGQYNFLDLEMGKEAHSGQTLYFMKNIKTFPKGANVALERQELYLLFPSDFSSKQRFFLVLLGIVCIPKNCTQNDLSLTNILSVIDSLALINR